MSKEEKSVKPTHDDLQSFLRHKEIIVREQRTIEATKKDMMGPGGKLGTIAKYLGETVKRQIMPDEPFFQEEEPELLTSDVAAIIEEGWIFDGLSRGIHLEIHYDEVYNRLKVTYKGYLVYEEVGGELETYVPFADWENLVERLYQTAEKVRNAKKVSVEENRSQILESVKKSFLGRLRYKWGI